MAKRGRPKLGLIVKRMSITFDGESLESLRKVKRVPGNSDNAKAIRESLRFYIEHRQDKDTLIGEEELKFFQSYIGLVGPATISELLQKYRQSRANT